MQAEFYGAARTVTGSCTLVESGGTRILVDCGQFQGPEDLERRNHEAFPFDPRTLSALVLTHAHVDHIGRAPALFRQGFRGRVVCTRATSELAALMLLDAAHIQAEDAERGGPPATYGVPEVEALWNHVESVPYGQTLSLGAGIDLSLRDAGHILGSAHVLLGLREQGRTGLFGISGDIGAKDRPVVDDPHPFERVDWLQMESTYGDRDHRTKEATVDEFRRILDKAVGDGGNVLIPAFSLGRTQDILWHLNDLKGRGHLKGLRVYVDSPLATRLTEVYRKNPAAFDGAARERLAKGDDPFEFEGLRFVRDFKESAELTRSAKGCAIIASSGMCQSGRILGHLREMLPRRETDVVIVGYQAPGTLGARLVAGEKLVRLRGVDVPVRATIHTLGGFSAHAGKSELVDWARAIQGRPKTVFVVHGEYEAQRELAKALTASLGLSVRIPRYGERVPLE
jgi:metallo-beta-lactamase family protein